MKSDDKVLTLIQKADLAVSDLIANGGYLPEDQAEKFIVDMIKEAVVMKMIEVQGIPSHTQLIDKIGFNGSVLRPGTSGQALDAADRAKPTTEQVTLSTKLFKAEIQLNDETLEDSIEKDNLKDTVMGMMTEQIALDFDGLLVNGDTTSLNTLWAQFDGMLALATAHVVAAGNNPIDQEYLKRAVKAMPSQYNRNRQSQVFMTSEKAEIDYVTQLANRMTGLGDSSISATAAPPFMQRRIVPVPTFPETQGGGSETSILLCDPKNAYCGIWRKIKIGTEYDLRAGIWSMVATMRAGFVWKETDAVVKVTGISIA
jgi:HK97 family phage major capsid protein